MLWTYNDSGYLVSVDMPEKNTCRLCGTKYRRRVRDSKPWQSETPDACPKCGHVFQTISGIAFENAAC